MIRNAAAILILVTSGITAEAQWLGLDIRQLIPAPQRIYSLALAKTNKDPFPDLVALPTGSFTSVYVYRSNQLHDFDFSSSFLKDENYRVLRSGDLDADGVDDLVISGYWNNGFKIFWGNEHGDYTEGEYYGLTGHGKNIELTDLNHDNALDVVALSGGSGQPITMHVFYGSNSKTLTPKGIYSSALDTDKRITVVDKDQNGLPDIMVASSFPWFVIFYQQADGSFFPRYWPNNIEFPFTSEYYLADLNNDTQQDILAFYPDEGFRFYEGKTDTLFSEQYFSCKTKINPVRIFTTDLNGDGSIDIVTDHRTREFEPTDTLYYFLGKGDFTFEAPKVIRFPSGVENFIVKDFNGDRYPDIIAYCSSGNIVTVLNEGVITGSENEDLPLQLYPNPFTDYLVFEAEKYPACVSVFDSRGNGITKMIVESKTLLNTASWLPGLYILQIESGLKSISRKITKF